MTPIQPARYQHILVPIDGSGWSQRAIPHAVRLARAYILGAIAAGADVRTGQGHGPLNHGHAPVAMRVLAGTR